MQGAWQGDGYSVLIHNLCLLVSLSLVNMCYTSICDNLRKIDLTLDVGSGLSPIVIAKI